jgi:uncharacterized protein (DUF433 family)
VTTERKKSRNVHADKDKAAKRRDESMVTRSVRLPKELSDWLRQEAVRERRHFNKQLEHLLEQVRQGKIRIEEDDTALERTYPHITKREGSPARLARVPRVRVAQIVMDYLAYGWSAEEMCRQHPYLRPAEAHSAMAYYYDHQQEVDEEIARESAEAEADRRNAPPSPFLSRLRANRGQGIACSEGERA